MSLFDQDFYENLKEVCQFAFPEGYDFFNGTPETCFDLQTSNDAAVRVVRSGTAVDDAPPRFDLEIGSGVLPGAFTPVVRVPSLHATADGIELTDLKGAEAVGHNEEEARTFVESTMQHVESTRKERFVLEWT